MTGKKFGFGFIALLLLLGGTALIGFFSVKPVYESHLMQDWQPIDATLIELGIRESVDSEDGTLTFQLYGSYDYTVNSKTYRSTRMSLHPGYDNSDWHHATFERLKAEERYRDAITVYVNPNEPSEAIVDTQVQWLWVIMFGFIGFLLHGFSLGMLLAARSES